MNLADLEALLIELRHLRTDHQWVEAKRAQRGLPDTTHETLSAFANTDGGLLLLGVDEAAGTFDVTGVEDPKQTLSDLQSQCALMSPPLRPTIDLLAHSNGTVIAAYIPAVPRNERPCHRQHEGPEAGSFIRVGDGDQHLTPTEVGQLLASRKGHDYGRTPAPDDAVLDAKATTAFCQTLRASNTRHADLDDATLLRRWSVTDEGGHPTLAGILGLGDTPQRVTMAARINYRRLPRRTDPDGTRHAGKHLEGTLGELLDDAMTALGADLHTVQVVRDGQVRDELDVPREALREMLSNALIHRSFAPGLCDSSIVIEVSDDAVVITSPGNLHIEADPEDLGLAHLSGVRNISLVRIGEQLRTPSGGRVVEHQTSGIAAADRACRTNGTMPALFADLPSAFQVVLLRGALDTTAATDLLTRAGLDPTGTRIRLLATLLRFEQMREQTAGSGLRGVVYSARLGARCLAPCTHEDAAAELRQLEDARLIRRSRTRQTPAWILTDTIATATTSSRPTTAPRTKTSNSRQDRIPELLAAINEADDGFLTAKAIGETLRLASPTSRNRWIRRAEVAGLIVATTDNPFDPTGGYKLTRQGRANITQKGGTRHVAGEVRDP